MTKLTLIKNEEATAYYFDMMETVFTSGLGFARDGSKNI